MQEMQWRCSCCIQVVVSIIRRYSVSSLWRCCIYSTVDFICKSLQEHPTPLGGSFSITQFPAPETQGVRGLLDGIYYQIHSQEDVI
jgi:hypothetical protein